MPDLSLDGRRIAFREVGEGPPVVLLHCSSSHSGQWKPWMAQLSEFAQVLAPDLHGYGRSDPLPVATPWWAADRDIVKALADHAGQKVHVIGHSLGGAAAFYAARRYPQCVASLTAIEPVLFGLLEQIADPGFADATTISNEVWGLLEGGEDMKAAKAFTDFWSGEGTFIRLQPHQADYVVQTIARVGDDWRGLAPELPGQIKLTEMEDFHHPVHLIKGNMSRPSAQRIVDLLSERLPRSDLTVIPGADHLGAVTRPEQFIPACVAWLEQHIAS